MNVKKLARWSTPWERFGSGYPLTIQILAALLLIALPCGVLIDAASSGAPLMLRQVLGLLALSCLALLFVYSVPMTSLRMWQQLCALALQCGLISAIQWIVPSPVSGYLFLVPVIQAVYLFGFWVWLPVAAMVWLAWGGTAFLASRGWLEWISANIYAIFLLIAVTLAAAVYTRQQRARTQIEGLMQRLQQQYQVAKTRLEHVSLQATLEERGRLVNTVSGELRLALSHLEQLVSRTITQTQASVSQTQPLLNQTQTYVRETVETLRAALATLRPSPGGLPIESMQQHVEDSLPVDQALTSPAVRHLLDWLPLVFGVLVPLWSLIEHRVEGMTFRLETIGIWLALVGFYGYTQWVKNRPWIHLGLLGQTCSLLVMVVLTQSPALLMGLTLVAGQFALRCTWSKQVAGFVAINIAVTLVVIVLNPFLWQSITGLLLFGTIITALVMPIISARRRLYQRTVANQLVRNVGDAVERLNMQAEALRHQAVLAERHRVAREIHDGLGCYLMAISLQLHVAQDALVSDPAVALRQLQDTQELIGKAQRQLLQSVDALNPLPDRPDALRHALDELVQQYTGDGAMQVTLNFEGSPDALPDDVNLALFRVAQEGLTNTVRHGQATAVWLTLTRWPAQVQLTVVDNGCGECAENRHGGLGLLGIKERAALLGGLCDVGTHGGGGFVLRFEVPLTEVIGP